MVTENERRRETQINRHINKRIYIDINRQIDRYKEKWTQQQENKEGKK